MHGTDWHSKHTFDKPMPSILSPSLLSRFPPGIRFACGYGSGVFSQGELPNTSNKQIDIILAVDSPITWHKQNKSQNFHDYAWITQYFMSPQIITTIQHWGGGFWFHPFIPISNNNNNIGGDNNKIQIKYGIIDVKDLIQDLTQWNMFYAAGRLQKPVAIIKTDDEINQALKTNLQLATYASLALLSNNNNNPIITKQQFFETLVGLSYAGDFRYTIGAESPTKIRDIVLGSKTHLDSLYFKNSNIVHDGLIIKHSDDDDDKESFTPKLTSKQYLAKLPVPYRNSTDHLQFRQTLSNIVQKSSMIQTMKGILTAGPGSSLMYSLAKLRKGKWF
jgi:translocator assembly and maintenance protein 41